MNEKAELSTKLIHELGLMKSAEIAEHFKGLGIKGFPEVSDRCAIAEYMKMRTGYQHVSIGAEMTGYDGAPYADVFNMDLPKSACEFITQFDDGAFPELIDHGGDI